MKKIKAISMTMILGAVFSIGVMAQAPPPPTDPAAGGNQHPAGPTGSPIDGGVGILLTLAAAYGLKKVHEVRKSEGQEVKNLN